MFINWCNANNGFIMAVLTFVYVVATIFIWWSNRKSANASQKQVEKMIIQNELMEKQLKKMEDDHQTKSQPYIHIKDTKFSVEPPRKYSVPTVEGENGKIGFSRYWLECELTNITENPAIGIVVLATITIPCDDKKLELEGLRDNDLSTFSAVWGEKIEVLSNKISENKKVSLSFLDTEAKVLKEMLRETPFVYMEIIVVYRSIAGGYFEQTSSYAIFGSPKIELKLIKVFMEMIDALNGNGSQKELEIINNLDREAIPLSLKFIKGSSVAKAINEEEYLKRIKECVIESEKGKICPHLYFGDA